MDKLCLACGKVTYIRMLQDRTIGRVCEGCQIRAISQAIDNSYGVDPVWNDGVENKLNYFENSLDR